MSGAAPSRSSSWAPAHLLVRLPNPVGDTVMATPALRALRRSLPRPTRITWAGRRAALQALDGLVDHRDGVLPVAGPFARGALSPWRAGRLWRRAGPDAVLLLTHSWRSALAARVSGAGRRTGWGGRARGVLLTEPVALPLDERGDLAPRSMVRMYLDLAAPYGAVDDQTPPAVLATDYDRRRAARRLAAFAVEHPLLAVSPGAAFGASKVLSPERLAPALAEIRDALGLLPLILCGPGEEPLAEALAGRLGPPAISTHTAPPDLGELKGLLVRSALFLGTDAGPRHLAEALGVPTVVWMGPTDPRWSEHSRARLVRHEGLDCLACHEPSCPLGHHRCMQELDGDRIVEAAGAALAGHAR